MQAPTSLNHRDDTRATYRRIRVTGTVEAAEFALGTQPVTSPLRRSVYYRAGRPRTSLAVAPHPYRCAVGVLPQWELDAEL